MILDFARARRNTFLALLALNKIQNASLPLRQHAGIIVQLATIASSNEQMLSIGIAIALRATLLSKKLTVIVAEITSLSF